MQKLCCKRKIQTINLPQRFSFLNGAIFKKRRYFIRTAVLAGLRRAQRYEIPDIVLGKSLQNSPGEKSTLAITKEIYALGIGGAYGQYVVAYLLHLTPHGLQTAPASVAHGVVYLRSRVHL